MSKKRIRLSFYTGTRCRVINIWFIKLSLPLSGLIPDIQTFE
jgi:hypothetical protein